MDRLVLLQLMGLDVRGNIADQCDRVAASSAGLLRTGSRRVPQVCCEFRRFPALSSFTDRDHGT